VAVVPGRLVGRRAVAVERLLAGVVRLVVLARRVVARPAG